MPKKKMSTTEKIIRVMTSYTGGMNAPKKGKKVAPKKKKKTKYIRRNSVRSNQK